MIRKQQKQGQTLDSLLLRQLKNVCRTLIKWLLLDSPLPHPCHQNAGIFSIKSSEPFGFIVGKRASAILRFIEAIDISSRVKRFPSYKTSIWDQEDFFITNKYFCQKNKDMDLIFLWVKILFLFSAQLTFKYPYFCWNKNAKHNLVEIQAKRLI